MSQTFQVRNVRCKGKVGGWGRKVFVGGRCVGFLGHFLVRFRMGRSIKEIARWCDVSEETAENIIRHAMNEEAQTARKE